MDDCRSSIGHRISLDEAKKRDLDLKSRTLSGQVGNWTKEEDWSE